MSGVTPSVGALKVLVLGGTGYIGGSVLDHLLRSRPTLCARLAFTLVVREQGKADQLLQRYTSGPDSETIKINIVLTDHADTKKIAELAAESDVVMNLADADDLNLAKAVNEGLIKCAKAHPQRRPLLLHTSGTSVFSDPKEEDGTHTTKHVYDDAHPDDFWSLPSSAPHHAVDLEVLSAQDKGVNTLIVAPCTIVGWGAGINHQSIQVPGLIKGALLRKPPQTGVLGTGANEWPYIHVNDLAEAYALLLIKGLGVDNDGHPLASDPHPLSFGRNGVFYPAAGHYTHRELAQRIASTLHRLAPDLVQTEDITPWTDEDIERALYGKKMVGLIYGGSVHVQCTRLPQLGWRPTHPPIFDTLEKDAQAQISKLRAGTLGK